MLNLNLTREEKRHEGYLIKWFDIRFNEIEPHLSQLRLFSNNDETEENLQQQIHQQPNQPNLQMHQQPFQPNLQIHQQPNQPNLQIHQQPFQPNLQIHQQPNQLIDMLPQIQENSSQFFDSDIDEINQYANVFSKSRSQDNQVQIQIVFKKLFKTVDEMFGI